MRFFFVKMSNLTYLVCSNARCQPFPFISAIHWLIKQSGWTKFLAKQFKNFLRTFNNLFEALFQNIIQCHVRRFWHHINKTSHHNHDFKSSEIQRLSAVSGHSDIKFQTFRTQFGFQELSRSSAHIEQCKDADSNG